MLRPIRHFYTCRKNHTGEYFQLCTKNWSQPAREGEFMEFPEMQYTMIPERINCVKCLDIMILHKEKELERLRQARRDAPTS